MLFCSLIYKELKPTIKHVQIAALVKKLFFFFSSLKYVGIFLAASTGTDFVFFSSEIKTVGRPKDSFK
jgi:hypothetical protein